MEEQYRELAVGVIIPHWELNREKKEEHVDALARHINENGFDKSYPLRVVDIGGEYHLAAGHHRLAAATLSDILYPNLPMERIWSCVIPGTMDDVIKVMQEDNFSHDPAVNPSVGLPLTRAEKAQQCKRLLMFEFIFRQSNRELGIRFGVHHTTVGRWREEVCVALQQMAAANLTEQQLLAEFAMTPQRLEVMLALVASGERDVKRGDSTYTQKTVAGERTAAIAEFRETHQALQAAIQKLVADKSTLQLSHVKGQLYAAFDLRFAANASKWPLSAIRNELRSMGLLLDMLENPKSALNYEYHMLHGVNTSCEQLDDLVEWPSAPITEAARQLQQEMKRHIFDPTWWDALRDERIEALEDMQSRFGSVFKDEFQAQEEEVEGDIEPEPMPASEPEPMPEFGEPSPPPAGWQGESEVDLELEEGTEEEAEPVGRGTVPRAEAEPVVRGTAPRAEEEAEPMPVDIPEEMVAEHRKMARVARDAANAIGSVMSLANRPMPSNVDFLNDYIQQFCPEAVERLGLLRSLILRTANELD